MEQENGRNVPVSELNERRVAAVRMRIDGATIEQTAAETGLSKPTIINAYKAYKSGGWEAVPVRNGGAREAADAPTEAPRQTVTAERDPSSLSHLERLEAESIHIMREVVAEAENPVMMYSIGKDSSVMLHLAVKAFYPSK